jgi:hypothetical protein
MVRKMEVIKTVEVKRDPTGFVLVKLSCPNCKGEKFVRRCDVKNRNQCAKCERDDRAINGEPAGRRRRLNKNITPGGAVLGGLDRYSRVFLYLEADTKLQCSLILSNKAERRPHAYRANWRWEFPNGDVPLMVLDTVGRNPKGDPFAVLNQLNALITLLKGE